jgi:hypothetical protein
MDNSPNNSPDIALHHAEVLLEEAVASYNLGAARARAADELINEARYSAPHAEAVKEKLRDAHLDAGMAYELGIGARDQVSNASCKISSVRPLPPYPSGSK